MNKIIARFLVLCLSVSCSFKEHKINECQEVSEPLFLIKENYILNYYDNGVLKDSIHHVERVRNGNSFHFDSLGRLSSIINYKNGKPLGCGTYFYENGLIKSRFCRNYDAETFFVEKFDSLGNKLGIDGFLISPTLNIKDKHVDSLYVGDTLTFGLFYAQPVVGYIEVEIHDDNNLKIPSKKLESNYVEFKKKYMEPREHVIHVSGVFINNGEVISSDTFDVSLKIRKHQDSQD